jgi:hypothetical protein
MPSGNGAELPDVTDEDIRRVSGLLELGEHAFIGTSGNDARLAALKRMDTFDVAACPGSGKTTLLVAKLAILAEKWPHRTRGICVLSHTNAARHEIEKRLGGTSAGRALLSYPHFVGTIHGFTNEFLALPWLRSNGRSGIRFDDGLSGDKLARILRNNQTVQSYLDKNFPRESERHRATRCISYVGSELDISIGAGPHPKRLLRSGDKPTFLALNDAKKKVLDDGLACYADAFGFAARAIRDSTWLVHALGGRFPLVFIDEAQDTNDAQAELLYRVFWQGNSPSVVQRVGDDNQAIYGFTGDTAPTTYKFPGPEASVDLPSSLRFGREIAALAKPLAVSGQELDGCGPPPRPEISTLCQPRHTIFLVDRQSVGDVLDAFGALLVRTFSASVLQGGHFAAVGAVHKEDENDETTPDRQFPKRVGDYWSGYQPNLSGAEPKPRNFVQFLRVARSRADKLNHSSVAVETIAEGLLRLVELTGGSRIVRTQRRHRQVLERLEQDDAGLSEYLELLRAFAIERATVDSHLWGEVWAPRVRRLAEAMAGSARSSAEADGFLCWPDDEQVDVQPENARSRDNVYVFGDAGVEVAIQLGSIHSMKGQTHTATLVLESFNRAHHLEKLSNWLLGKATGRKVGSNQAELDRLRMHYVAMTRPTHLLCLAMKRSSFENKPGFDANKAKLEARGWTMHDLTQNQPRAQLGSMESA